MNNINIKGYSHEIFKIGSKYIYKYTNDESRKDFVKNQYHWMNGIKRKFPQYAFTHLFLVDEKTETGYSMSRIDTKEMTKDNVKDLVQIVLDIKLPITEIHKVLPYHPAFHISSGNDNSIDIRDKNLYFDAYVNYLKKIVLRNPDVFSDFDWELYEKEMYKHEKFANKSLSFYHGDLTIDNILWDGTKYTLIDPNYKADIWGSYLLDLSKLYQETRFDKEELFRELQSQIKKKFAFSDTNMRFLDLLEISHYIRMMPYVRKFKDIYSLKQLRMQAIYKNILF